MERFFWAGKIKDVVVVLGQRYYAVLFTQQTFTEHIQHASHLSKCNEKQLWGDLVQFLHLIHQEVNAQKLKQQIQGKTAHHKRLNFNCYLWSPSIVLSMTSLSPPNPSVYFVIHNYFKRHSIPFLFWINYILL